MVSDQSKKFRHKHASLFYCSVPDEVIENFIILIPDQLACVRHLLLHVCPAEVTSPPEMKWNCWSQRYETFLLRVLFCSRISQSVCQILVCFLGSLICVNKAGAYLSGAPHGAKLEGNILDMLINIFVQKVFSVSN